MTFGEETRFTATGRKKFSTVRRLQVKVANSSITDEICIELDSHANTCVMIKECLKVYNWNHPVNVSGWNPKYRERLWQKNLGQWHMIIRSQGKYISSFSISVFMSTIWTTTCYVQCSVGLMDLR